MTGVPHWDKPEKKMFIRVVKELLLILKWIVRII